MMSRFLRNNVTNIRHRLHLLPKWVVGFAVATPAVALVQGVIMLQDFRARHCDAPTPVSPSRGIVVMKSEELELASSKQSFHHNENPLRLLVIGDSLAAGVGISKHGTPVLPESIAKALSHNLGGRAVRWTCVGTPGASAAQIVHDILGLQREPNLLEGKLAEWKATKRRAAEWIEDRKAKKQNLDDAVTAGNRIQSWWRRLKLDIHSFRSHVMAKTGSTVDDDENLSYQGNGLRRNLSMINSNEYDVAIVLTGLNDLKDMCLPFMMRGANASMSHDARETASKEGLKGELMRVLAALRKRMKSPYAFDGETVVKDGRSPLVVFPALPTSPLPLCQHAPLSWFIVPLLEMIDNHKKRLAETFPNFVLFVEPPSVESLEDIEAGRGPIFHSRKAEQVLLQITDVTSKAKERVELLMRQHYQRLTNDLEKRKDESSQDVYHQGCHDHLPVSSHKSNPGSTLIAVDNVHPNDDGYDFWGRHIAAAIVTEWEHQLRQN